MILRDFHYNCLVFASVFPHVLPLLKLEGFSSEEGAPLNNREPTIEKYNLWFIVFEDMLKQGSLEMCVQGKCRGLFRNATVLIHVCP